MSYPSKKTVLIADMVAALGKKKVVRGALCHDQYPWFLDYGGNQTARW